MKLTKNLLFTALISAAALLSAAETGEAKPEAAKLAAAYKSTNKEPLDFKNYANTIHLPAGFSMNLKKLDGKEVVIDWEIELQGTEEAQFTAAKFRNYTSDKKDVMYDLIRWKTPVKMETAKLTGKCKVKIAENYARSTLVLYNCTVKGVLRVKSITLTATEAPAEKK